MGDLSHMVQEQGEAIDRIETHVSAAAEQVESGRDQLQKAEKHKKSARRLKFILAAIGAGVANPEDPSQVYSQQDFLFKPQENLETSASVQSPSAVAPPVPVQLAAVPQTQYYQP